MSKIVLSLGSNIGESKLKLADNLKRAIHLLKEKVSKIVTSSLYETSAVDYLHQANFLNQVALGETNLLPLELLSFVKGIEKKMKSKKLIPKGPRIIDIDLIFFNGLKINHEGLTIPHPEFSKRLFVLLPLLEIEKEFVDPVNKVTIKSYLKSSLYKSQKISLLNLP